MTRSRQRERHVTRVKPSGGWSGAHTSRRVVFRRAALRTEIASRGYTLVNLFGHIKVILRLIAGYT